MLAAWQYVIEAKWDATTRSDGLEMFTRRTALVAVEHRDQADAIADRAGRVISHGHEPDLDVIRRDVRGRQ